MRNWQLLSTTAAAAVHPGNLHGAIIDCPVTTAFPQPMVLQVQQKLKVVTAIERKGHMRMRSIRVASPTPQVH